MLFSVIDSYRATLILVPESVSLAFLDDVFAILEESSMIMFLTVAIMTFVGVLS